MKRLSALFLAILICFSFAACEKGKGTSATPKQNASSYSSEKVSESASNTESAGEKEADIGDPGSTPLLYKATHPSGGTIWILGSIHVGLEEMYPLPKYLISAYFEADSLAVECDITAEGDEGSTYDMLRKFSYTDGSTISDHIPEELYQNAVKALEDIGLYNEYLDYYKPILWQNFIEVSMYDEFGYDSDLGIDMHLLELASKDNKPIIEIESAEFQYNMLADFSPELQELLLEDTVESYNDIEESQKDMEELLELWREGNEQKFSKELTEEDYSDLTKEEIKLAEEYDKAMLRDRNIGMADFAENELKNGKKTFICVGAAHVVGEGATVDLLRQRGYTVELVSE